VGNHAVEGDGVIAAGVHGGVEMGVTQRCKAAVDNVDHCAGEGVGGLVVTRLVQHAQHGVWYRLLHSVETLQPQLAAAPEVCARVLPLKPQIGPTSQSLQRLQTQRTVRVVHRDRLRLKIVKARVQGAELQATCNAERQSGHGGRRYMRRMLQKIAEAPRAALADDGSSWPEAVRLWWRRLLLPPASRCMRLSGLQMRAPCPRTAFEKS
jgi:hypothetical protein